MKIDCFLQIEDNRIEALFLNSQKTMVIRVAWSVLVLNFLLCVQLTCALGLEFFQIVNVAILCVTNGGSIFVIIGAYSR